MPDYGEYFGLRSAHYNLLVILTHRIYHTNKNKSRAAVRDRLVDSLCSNFSPTYSRWELIYDPEFDCYFRHTYKKVRSPDFNIDEWMDVEDTLCETDSDEESDDDEA